MLWATFSLALALMLARRGIRKGSLSLSGAAAAAVVGFTHMYAGFEFGTTLILFYLSSSKLTKLRQDQKQALQEEFHEGGQRNALQVLCNSLGGCLSAALASGLVVLPALGDPGIVQLAATGAFLGHYACCCADTWASEVGILSSRQPRLITTWRKVPAGTNGGVSSLGTGCSLVAGAFIGVVYAAAAGVKQLAEGRLAAGGGAEAHSIASFSPTAVRIHWLQPQLVLAGGQVAGCAVSAVLVVVIAVCLGLLGSVLDSLLGATVQFSGVSEHSKRVVNHPGRDIKHICGANLLSNNAVNAVAATTTAAAGSAGLCWMLKECAGW